MPNHVHAVFTLITETSNSGKANILKQLMPSIKRYTAHDANKILHLSGTDRDGRHYNKNDRPGWV
ncbi:hypothetical protein [Spirosoma aerophilum]